MIFAPIDFVGRFDEALKNYDSFAKKVENNNSKIGDSLGKLEFIAKGFIGALAVGKVVDGLQAVIGEAAEGQRVFNQMAGALRSAGDYSEQNVEYFSDLADQLSRASEFGDDLILSQIKVAKQFGLTNKEADKLVRTAVDLAAATDKDLNGAALKLAQTYDGTAGKLAQLFPQLQNLTAEQLRNGAAVDVLASKYKGAAQNALNDFEGQTALITNNFHNLEEALGDVIVKNDGLILVFKAVNGFIDRMIDLVEKNKEGLAKLVTQGLAFAVRGFGILIDIVALTALHVRGLIADVVLIKDILASPFHFAMEDVLKSLGKAFTDYNNTFKELQKGAYVVGDFQKSYNALADDIDKAAASTGKFAVGVAGAKVGLDDLGANAKRISSEIRKDFEALQKKMETMGSTPLLQLRREYEKNIQLIETGYKNTWVNEVKRAEYLGQLRMKFVEDEAELRRQEFAKYQAAVQAAYQNPAAGIIQSLNGGKDPDAKGSLGLSKETQVAGAAAGGIVKGAFGGKEGARSLLSGAVGAIATQYLGPLGGVVGDLVGELSKGKENVKAMFTEFFNALPDLIQNIIEALPEVISIFAEKLPEVIDRLIDRAPEIIEALIKALPRLIIALVLLMPRVIIALVAGAFRFAGKILEGAGQFVFKILEGAVKFVGKILEGAAKFVAEIVKGAGKVGSGILGLDGKSGIGGVVNSVIAPVKRIFRFKGGGGEEDLSAVTPSAQSFGKTSGDASTTAPQLPTVLEVSMAIGNGQLAKAIVDLQKMGYKLVPA